MKIAIIHPWFLEQGGGEKVVEALAAMYPDADIFALSSRSDLLPSTLRGRHIYTSSLDRLIKFGFRYKRACFMPLFPLAVERMDVTSYDLVISSCGPAVMGVNTRQDAVHISYVHSPQRAWWDLYASRQSHMPWIVRQAFVPAASLMRIWEFNAMQRVDSVVANSRYIAQRISKYFRRDSTVIYPPVDTSMGYISERPGDYYLSLSRLDIDKRIDLLILACNRLRRRLLVAGSGRKEKELKRIAGPTIEFLGRVPDAELRELYANCRALLFAADEDFGIVPVEAQAFGRPVIAYGRGGVLETVRVSDLHKETDTGVLFPEQTAESITEGILRFEAREHEFSPSVIRDYAKRFDTSVFIENMRNFVDGVLEQA